MSQIETISSKPLRARSFYQSLFFSFLAQMKRGVLTVKLPNGQALKFGGDDKVVEAQIEICDEHFFKRCILFGDIGFGESYVKGEWRTNSIVDVIRWMIVNWENNPAVSGSKSSAAFLGLLKLWNRISHVMKGNSLDGSLKNISAHYDLSNELFSAFLDPSMTYSCADFSKGARSLEDAQIDKFERLAKAAQIKPEDKVLEIGGGWGGFAIYLAKNYGCKVCTITISRNQFSEMSRRIASAGLQNFINVQLVDYRLVEGQFNKIVSVEMLEAVGHRHLPTFFKVCDRLLAKNGLVAVQVITSADSRYEKLRKGVDWIQKHIFPGSLLPSLGALCDAARSTSTFQMHSLHNMGDQYARTLAEWRRQFNASLHVVRKLGFDDEFIRSWNYYLSYCEAAFERRHIGLAQIVFTRPNNNELVL